MLGGDVAGLSRQTSEGRLIYGEGGSGANGSFEGYPAYVEETNGKTNIYYGPNGPLGPGHGHVVTNPEGGVGYWREPGGGPPIMNNGDNGGPVRQ